MTKHRPAVVPSRLRDIATWGRRPPDERLGGVPVRTARDPGGTVPTNDGPDGRFFGNRVRLRGIRPAPPRELRRSADVDAGLAHAADGRGRAGRGRQPPGGAHAPTSAFARLDR